MTLAELLAAHADAFLPQTWYESEAFMRGELPATIHGALPRIKSRGALPSNPKALPTTAELCMLYLTSPLDDVWVNYLWCADYDRHGQRVFVGGSANLPGPRRLEIHRHIHITDRFGTPIWT